ncbi:MBL fold metallo-hydrolase [Chondrinema litorale]|uniref:MBL fold metallo-hydrolase n=1 Tax=Chondrinema litorale TaxID=2994555 RepID=UPI00254293D2|nr:MBL fold metallo-hydrolase [Chondrinema litorale]UZR93916.1 MBL fold metallo-hydrolase [Chondrinema litorale]
MVTIKFFTNGGFGENTYILSDESKSCIIIDPGCYQKVEEEDIKNYIEENNLKVEKIVNTHCHIDHVLGNYAMKKAYDVPIYIPENELEVLRSVPAYAPMWGFPAYQPQEPDVLIKREEKTIEFGNTSLEILYVPGHAPGHLAYYHKEEKFCINGDVLFRMSVGRTDLPGGNHSQLMDSIRNVMYQLPDDVTVYCGHGDETTIGFEKKHNPFCRVN